MCAIKCVAHTGRYGKCTAIQKQGDICLLANSVPNCSPGGSSVQPTDPTAVIKQITGPSPLRGTIFC